MSSEEITSLYHAIKQPEHFRNVFEALGLSETKFKMIEAGSHTLDKSEKEEIIKNLLEILLNLDTTAELPSIIPKTNLEAFISPRDQWSSSVGNITNFKNVYEDPRKDPRYKYQTSPFKKPKNDIEKSFDEFLNKIKDDNVEKPSLRQSNATQSLPKLQSVNRAFKSSFFNSMSPLAVRPNQRYEDDNTYDHDRALKNWGKVKTVMKMSLMTSIGMKGAFTQKLKKLAKDGELKKVLNATESRLQETYIKKEERKYKNIIKSAKSLCKFKICNYYL